MNFDGHWLPLQVANVMFWIWGLEVLGIAAFFYWFMRGGHRTKPRKKTSSKIGRDKRKIRHKR